jgi:hypothetical protein
VATDQLLSSLKRITECILVIQCIFFQTSASRLPLAGFSVACIRCPQKRDSIIPSAHRDFSRPAKHIP